MPKKKTSPKPDNVAPMPDAWRGAFKGATMRSSFSLTLSHAMLEFFCAVGDGVWGDRTLYFNAPGVVDNSLTSARALEKRGLIVHSSGPFTDEDFQAMWDHGEMRGIYVLTPAGEKVFELLKLTGIYVENDAAIAKKVRERRR